MKISSLCCLYVLKANATFPDKTPASSAPLFEQQVNEVPPPVFSIPSLFCLASPETASDADYATILGVIGHEYFHNWTGNRVTCRDWFRDSEEDEDDLDSEEINDMIETGYKEKPFDNEIRNQLHQKWLEQQDADGTENMLRRLKCGSKQRETTLLEGKEDEVDEEEFLDEAAEVTRKKCCPDELKESKGNDFSNVYR